MKLLGYVVIILCCFINGMLAAIPLLTEESVNWPSMTVQFMGLFCGIYLVENN